MSEALAGAVFGGVFGSIVGAVIGALVTLVVQRRTFDHDRRVRFLELRRDRYATLLAGADEWARLLTLQRANAMAAIEGGKIVDGQPSLGETTDLWHLAQGTALLSDRVSAPAKAFIDALVDLGPYAVNAHRPELLLRMPGFQAAMDTYLNARMAFIAAAGKDLREA